MKPNYLLFAFSFSLCWLSSDAFPSSKFQAWPPRLIDNELTYPLASYSNSWNTSEWSIVGQASFDKAQSRLVLPIESSFRIFLEPNQHFQLSQIHNYKNLSIAELQGAIWLEPDLTGSDNALLITTSNPNGAWFRLIHNNVDPEPIELQLSLKSIYQSRPNWENWFKPLSMDSAQRTWLVDRFGHRHRVYAPLTQQAMSVAVKQTGWLRLSIRAVYSETEENTERQCNLKYYHSQGFVRYLQRQSPPSLADRSADHKLLYGQAAISYLEITDLPSQIFFELSENCVASLDLLAENAVFSLPAASNMTLVDAIPELGNFTASQNSLLPEWYITFKARRFWQLGSEFAGQALNYVRQERLYYNNLKPKNLDESEMLLSHRCPVGPTDLSLSNLASKLAPLWYKHHRIDCLSLSPASKRQVITYDLPKKQGQTMLRLLVRPQPNVDVRLRILLKTADRVSSFRILSDNESELSIQDDFHRLEIEIPAGVASVSIMREDENFLWPEIAVQILTERDLQLDFETLHEISQSWDQDQFQKVLAFLSTDTTSVNTDSFVMASMNSLRERFNWYRRISLEPGWKYWPEAAALQVKDLGQSEWFLELSEQGRFHILERVCQLKQAHHQNSKQRQQALECLENALRHRSALWHLLGIKIDGFRQGSGTVSLLEIAEILEELDHRPEAAFLYLAVWRLSTDGNDSQSRAEQGWLRFAAESLPAAIPDHGQWQIQQYESIVRFPSPISGQELQYYRITPERPLLIDLQNWDGHQLKITTHLELDQNQDKRQLNWLHFHHQNQSQAIPIASSTLSPDLQGQTQHRYTSAQELWLHNLQSGKLVLKTTGSNVIVRLSESRPTVAEAGPWFASFDALAGSDQIYRLIDQVHQNFSEAQQRHHFQTHAMVMLHGLRNRSWGENLILDILESLSQWEYFRPPQSPGGWIREDLAGWKPDHPQLAVYQQMLAAPRASHLGVLYGDLEHESTFEIQRPGHASIQLELAELYEDGLGDHEVEIRWGQAEWKRYQFQDNRLKVGNNLKQGSNHLSIRFADHRPGRIAYLYLSLEGEHGSHTLAPRQQRTWLAASRALPIVLQFPQAQLLRIHQKLDSGQKVSYVLLSANEIWSSEHQGNQEQAAYRFYKLATRDTIPSFRLPQVRESSGQLASSSPAIFTSSSPAQLRSNLRLSGFGNRSQALGLALESQCLDTKAAESNLGLCSDRWQEKLHWRIIDQRQQDRHRLQIEAYPQTNPLLYASYLWTRDQNSQAGLAYGLGLNIYYARLNESQDHFWAAAMRPELSYSYWIDNWRIRSQLRAIIREYNLGARDQLPSSAWNQWMEDHQQIIWIAQNISYQARADQEFSLRGFAASNPPGNAQILDHMGLSAVWQSLWAPFTSSTIGIRTTHYFVDDLRSRSVWSFAPSARFNYLYGAAQNRPWNLFVQLGSQRDLERDHANIVVGLETILSRTRSSISPSELDAMNLPFSQFAQSERFRSYSKGKNF